MGAEGSRSFSAIREARLAKFISYREAISKIAMDTGDNLVAVASELMAENFGDPSHVRVLTLRGPEQSIVPASSWALNALLSQTLMTSSISAAEGWSKLDTIGDPDLDGWDRGEFVEALVRLKLPCPSSLREPSIAPTTDPRRPPNSAPPESGSPPRDSVLKAPSSDELLTGAWQNDFRGREWISLGDAAVILAGLSPSHAYRWGADERNLIDPCRDSLRRATKIPVAERGIRAQAPLSIEGSVFVAPDLAGGRSWRKDIKDDSVMILHEDIRAWCIRHGRHWPIPELSPMLGADATDAGAQVEVERLKAEIEWLKNLHESEMAEMRRTLVAQNVADVQRERDEARQEINLLKSCVPPCDEFLIPMVVAVQRRFWADWDDSKPRPKAAEEILPWICENFPQIADSKALIQAVEKVACPFNRNPSAKK